MTSGPPTPGGVPFPTAWRDETYAYLTTTGRRTGRPHEIEIWFVLHEGTVAMISGGGDRSDWVRNLLADPSVRLRIAGEERPAQATTLPDSPEHPARRLLAAKYQNWREGQPLSSWARGGLLVVVSPV